MTMSRHSLCTHFAAQTCGDGDIRLVGGANNMEGRVEVCNDNTWGTVCDDSFTTPDGHVACRQLGFSAGMAGYLYLTIAQHCFKPVYITMRIL